MLSNPPPILNCCSNRTNNANTFIFSLSSPHPTSSPMLPTLIVSFPPPRPLLPCLLAACKRKEQDTAKDRNSTPKKSRLVFTDLQRRTLLAIFKENKRPSKEMQLTISQQLGLELTTVSNFFMNARRRSLDKWTDDGASPGGQSSASSTCTKA